MATRICYELRVPRGVADVDAVRLLDDLRKRALTLDVCSVTPLWRLSGKELLLESWHRWLPLRMRHLTARPFDAERDAARPVDVAGFMVRPSPHSESAVFGLFRQMSPDSPEDRDWFWDFYYESNSSSGGRTLMQLLFAAREMGFEVRFSVRVDTILSNVGTRETHQVGAVRVNEASMLTWMPSASLEAVRIKPARTRDLERPEGSIITRWSAPAILWVEGRETIEDVIVCESGEEPVLGWHALSGLNLRLDEATGRLVDRGPIPAAAA